MQSSEHIIEGKICTWLVKIIEGDLKVAATIITHNRCLSEVSLDKTSITVTTNKDKVVTEILVKPQLIKSQQWLIKEESKNAKFPTQFVWSKSTFAGNDGSRIVMIYPGEKIEQVVNPD